MHAEDHGTTRILHSDLLENHICVPAYGQRWGPLEDHMSTHSHLRGLVEDYTPNYDHQRHSVEDHISIDGHQYCPVEDHIYLHIVIGGAM